MEKKNLELVFLLQHVSDNAEVANIVVTFRRTINNYILTWCCPTPVSAQRNIVLSHLSATFTYKWFVIAQCGLL